MSDQPLSDAELGDFTRLLRRVIETEIDQFLQLSLETKWGTFYVDISQMPSGDVVHYISFDRYLEQDHNG